MLSLLKSALSAGLKLNQQALEVADNAFDWLFLRETLIKSGLTPHEVIYAGDPMSLRYYPPPEESHIELDGGQTLLVNRSRVPMPLLLVPPLGVTTETFDLMPHRSLVRYMTARGFHVYMIDWGKPEKRHAHLSLKDYAGEMFATAVSELRAHAGVKEVSLMGWCMGGLLSLMHMGLSQDPYIKNLVTVASPIDLRGGGLVAQASTVLNTPARLIRKFSRFRLHNLDGARLASPGWATTLAFKLTDPIGSITTYWDLLTRLGDRAFLESHSTTADYLNNMLMYPGGVIQDMVVTMAVDNQLATGRIEIRGQVADLASIRANFLAFAGETDILVPPDIAKRSMELVGSIDKAFHVAKGGHMGVILGSKALLGVWQPTADWLLARSQIAGAAQAAEKAEQALKAVRRRRAVEDPTL
jgi:polyhydroxyalkanoate synthase